MKEKKEKEEGRRSERRRRKKKEREKGGRKTCVSMSGCNDHYQRWPVSPILNHSIFLVHLKFVVAMGLVLVNKVGI